MEQQNQQPIQEKTENKPPIKTFLIVALAAVILAVSGILLLKAIQPAPVTQTPPPPAPSPQPQPISNEQSAIDTSEWQTYRNEEFGFEFEYPSDMPFEIYSESSDNVFIGIGPWEAGRGGTNYASFAVNDVTQYRYRLEKLPKDLYEYSKMLISLGDFEPGVQIYFVNEGGELGMKLPYSTGDESEKLITTYYFYKKPYIFVFSLNFPLRGDLNKLYAKKIEKIVNTFRFIE